MKRQKLASTKKGIENFITGSLLEIRPMSIEKIQGLRCKCATVDEWLSGTIREDPISAIEQGVKKVIILDGRVPHAILMELLTDQGAGTMIQG